MRSSYSYNPKESLSQEYIASHLDPSFGIE